MAAGAHRLFFALGLGSYAVVELGFLGTWSAQLRWAFTARIALLLLAVPALIALGKPVELARAGMGEAGRDRLDGVLSGRTARILGNAMLWFIAEAADVPVLILLLLRWARRDRAEAADFDALTDAEHDALVQAHLRGARAGSDAAR